MLSNQNHWLWWSISTDCYCINELVAESGAIMTSIVDVCLTACNDMTSLYVTRSRVYIIV